jgi:hypothetical protein
VGEVAYVACDDGWELAKEMARTSYALYRYHENDQPEQEALF